MSLLNTKLNSDIALYNYITTDPHLLAQDIITLSEFSSVIYFNAVRSKLSATDIYSLQKRHRSRVFR